MKRKIYKRIKVVMMSCCGGVIALLLCQPIARAGNGSAPPSGSAEFTDANYVVFANDGKVETEDQTDVTVSGKITDESGQGVPGVNILLKGTSTGTTSDSNGNYKIVLPDANGVLVFSFIGYATQEVSVVGRTVVDVAMQADAVALSEVVVTGYGSQSKRDITGGYH